MNTHKPFLAKLSILVSLVAAPCLLLAQQTPSIVWQRCLGGTNYEGPGGARSIQQTHDGGYIVIGTTSSIDGDVIGYHGDSVHDDIWVVKLDSARKIQWQRCLGGRGYDEGTSIIQTSDKGYALCGHTNSDSEDVSGNHGNYDAWVVKLDSGGKTQWQQCLGGSGSDYANSIIQNSQGDYIIAGTTASHDESLNNHGGEDAYIIKLSSSGNIIWQKCFGGSRNEYASSIIQTKDGGYIFTGVTNSTDGDVLGYHPDTTATSDTILGPYHNSDVWVVKLDTSGKIQWQKCLGGAKNDEANSILQTSDKGYILCGSTTSDDGDITGWHSGWEMGEYPSHPYPDVWIIKLDSVGSIQWQNCFGGTGEDWGSDVIPTFDGGYIFTGSTASNDGDVTGRHAVFLNPDPDMWVGKLTVLAEAAMKEVIRSFKLPTEVMLSMAVQLLLMATL